MSQQIKRMLPVLMLLLWIGFSPASAQTGPIQLNLGVAGGSSITPRYLALNDAAGLLYVLSDGLATNQQGNTLSEFDLATGQFTRQIVLNQGDNEVLGLQFDPDVGLIYAHWHDRYGTSRPLLTVIESDTFQPSQDIVDIDSFAVANGMLYTVTADNLAVVNLSNNSFNQAQRVPIPVATSGPMAVSPVDNRLTIARGNNGVWNLEIYTLDTLNPVTTVPAYGEVLALLPHSVARQLFVVTRQGDLRVLDRLTSDGEVADLPFELGPAGSFPGVALSPDGQTFYYSNGLFRPVDASDPSPGPALIGLDSTTLSQIHQIPLLDNVDAITINPDGSQIYGLYPYSHHLYVIDPTAETSAIIATLVKLRAALVDAANNRLFISDSANRVRQFNLDMLEPEAELTLQNNVRDFGFSAYNWSGDLALDPSRHRLYVSGLSASVLELSPTSPQLSEAATLEPGGQISPDPGGDTLYLTNCGINMYQADSLSQPVQIPGSGPHDSQLVPNPCASYSSLDAENQWLHSLISNGVAGSNSGTSIQTYHVDGEPVLIFEDPNISFTDIEPDAAGDRAFVNFIRHSNRRLQTLDLSDPENIGFSHHLLGIWGELRYSPTTNRLYMHDVALNRLLIIEPDSLAIVAELPLPAEDAFELLAINPVTDQLYLTDAYGMLFIVDPDAPLPATVPPPAPAVPLENPGPVRQLNQPANSPILARIEEKTGEYSTEPRLYSSTEQGKSWRNLSQQLPPFPVQALAVSADFAQDQTMFASVLVPGQAGGLYQSGDGGQSWQAAMRGLQDVWVNALTIDPNFAQSGLIFAHTPYAGLHLSGDGGQSWQPLIELDANLTYPPSGTAFAAAFGKNSILISQDLEQMRGLYRTNQQANDLSAWQQTLDQPATHMAVSPGGLAALAFGRALWRSSDGGQSWLIAGNGLTGIENLQASQLFFMPHDEASSAAYFLFSDMAGSSLARLFRSLDGGQSWQRWQNPPSDKYFTAVTADPEGYLLFGDAQGQLTRINPAEMTWADPVAPETPFLPDSLAAAPDGNTVFALSSQHGLFKSEDGGQSWQYMNFPARLFGFNLDRFRLAVSPAYAQDNTLYATTGLSLHRSTDGGQSWQQLALNAANPAETFQAQQLALSPTFGQERTLLVSTPTAIYRSADGGDSWQAVLAADGEASATDLLTLAPNGQDVYARFGFAHGLFHSSDGGQSWQPQLGSGDDLFTINSAATNQAALLTTALEYDSRLLQTGPQLPPWQVIGENLPPELALVSAVAVDAQDTLFTGGEGGLFSSSDNGLNWQPVPSAGLPPQPNVHSLTLTPTRHFVVLADGTIFAAAPGGSWSDVSIIK